MLLRKLNFLKKKKTQGVILSLIFFRVHIPDFFNTYILHIYTDFFNQFEQIF